MKKRYIAAIAAMLCACIGTAGVGATLSFFSNTSNVVNNLSFIGENGMDAELTEPSWNPEQGEKAIPNETIPKDPQIRNTSEADIDEIVAVQVRFVYGAGCPDESKAGKLLSDADMAYVCDVYKIDYNADAPELGDWVRFDGESGVDQVQHFYYKEILKRNYPGEGDTTVPLFTGLAIPKDVNNERYSHIQDMGGFDILIYGKVVQQMTGDGEFGINSPEEAYKAGLLSFEAPDGAAVGTSSGGDDEMQGQTEPLNGQQEVK